MLSFIVLLERAGGRAMVPQVNAIALLGIKNNTTCPNVSVRCICQVSRFRRPQYLTDLCIMMDAMEKQSEKQYLTRHKAAPPGGKRGWASFCE